MTEELPSVEILRLEQGDVIVASLDETIHFVRDHVENIRKALRNAFPDHEVIVCGGGLKLSVARQGEEFPDAV